MEQTITAQLMKRVFIYDHKRFEDPDPASTPEEVIELLSTLEPEMACGYVKESKMNPDNENEMIYELGINIGTKA